MHHFITAALVLLYCTQRASRQNQGHTSTQYFYVWGTRHSILKAAGTQGATRRVSGRLPPVAGGMFFTLNELGPSWDPPSTTPHADKERSRIWSGSTNGCENKIFVYPRGHILGICLSCVLSRPHTRGCSKNKNMYNIKNLQVQTTTTDNCKLGDSEERKMSRLTPNLKNRAPIAPSTNKPGPRSPQGVGKVSVDVLWVLDHPPPRIMCK